MERNRADAKVKSTKSKSFVMVTNSDNRTLSVVTTVSRTKWVEPQIYNLIILVEYNNISVSTEEIDAMNV